MKITPKTLTPGAECKPCEAARQARAGRAARQPAAQPPKPAPATGPQALADKMAERHRRAAARAAVAPAVGLEPPPPVRRPVLAKAAQRAAALQEVAGASIATRAAVTAAQGDPRSPGQTSPAGGAVSTEPETVSGAPATAPVGTMGWRVSVLTDRVRSLELRAAASPVYHLATRVDALEVLVRALAARVAELERWVQADCATFPLLEHDGPGPGMAPRPALRLVDRPATAGQDEGDEA